MSGRRSHVRFAVLRSAEGVLRVMRDVIVQGAGDEGVVAISREPGVLGDTVVIHVPTDDAGAGLRVRVVESQPVVVDGTVRHRLRLLELEGSSARRAAADAVQRGTAP